MLSAASATLINLHMSGSGKKKKKTVWNSNKPLKENQDNKFKRWIITSFCVLWFIWKAPVSGFVLLLSDIDFYLQEVKEEKLGYCFNVGSCSKFNLQCQTTTATPQYFSSLLCQVISNEFQPYAFCHMVAINLKGHFKWTVLNLLSIRLQEFIKYSFNC